MCGQQLPSKSPLPNSTVPMSHECSAYSRLTPRTMTAGSSCSAILPAHAQHRPLLSQQVRSKRQPSAAKCTLSRQSWGKVLRDPALGCTSRTTMVDSPGGAPEGVCGPKCGRCIRLAARAAVRQACERVLVSGLQKCEEMLGVGVAPPLLRSGALPA